MTMTRLTDREKLALDLFKKGFNGAQIARALDLSRQRVNLLKQRFIDEKYLTQDKLDNPDPITVDMILKTKDGELND